MVQLPTTQVATRAHILSHIDDHAQHVVTGAHFETQPRSHPELVHDNVALAIVKIEVYITQQSVVYGTCGRFHAFGTNLHLDRYLCRSAAHRLIVIDAAAEYEQEHRT